MWNVRECFVSFECPRDFHDDGRNGRNRRRRRRREGGREGGKEGGRKGRREGAREGDVMRCVAGITAEGGRG